MDGRTYSPTRIAVSAILVVAAAMLLVALNLLARVQGGRYVRPIGQAMMKVPFLKKYLQKASRASLEKQNPELASAMAKLERSGVQNDPQRAQAALSRLSAAERKAWLEAAGQQGAIPEPMNRQQRRQQAKLKKNR